MAPLYQHFNKQKVLVTPIMLASNWTRGSSGAVTSNSEISNIGSNLIFTQNYLTNPPQGYVGWKCNSISDPYSFKTITMIFDNVSNNNSRLGITFSTSYVFYSLSLYDYLKFSGINASSNPQTVNISTPWGTSAWMYINGIRVIDSGTDFKIQYSTDHGVTWSSQTTFGSPTWDRQNRNLISVGVWFNTPPGSVYTIREYTAI